MKTTDLKIGDVVRLRGADVCMTVDSIERRDVECAWFDTNGACHRAWFKYETLVKIQFISSFKDDSDGR